MRRTGALVAVLLVVACGGEKAGDRGWLKSGRTEVSGTVGGVSFALQVPQGFAKSTAGPSGMEAWSNAGDEVTFTISASDEAIASVDAAVAATAMPDTPEPILKQSEVPDGFLVTRTNQPGDLINVRVFRRAGGKMLECLGQNRTSGKPDEVAAVQAGLEEVCLSMKPK
jgi:hypothetical protein